MNGGTGTCENGTKYCMEPQMRPWTVGTWLLALFSGLAVAVGAVGLCAAFSHAVMARRREMAIRMAVGASGRGVLAMVLREAALIAGAGVLLGGVAVAIASTWLRSLLYDTSAADPVVLGAAAVVMLAVAMTATLMPARTASRINPAALLRAE
jgi:ABC-type antimicrobial peptide transport system permease subunit